jgi:hypothetical protein
MVALDYGQPVLYTKLHPHLSHKATPGKLPSSKSTKSHPKTSSSSMRDVSDAFHVSIAWTLTPPRQELLNSTESTAKDCFEKITQLRVDVSEIKAKIGNVVTNLSLPNSVLEGRKLFGA